VLNKSDLLPPEEARVKAIGIAQALDYRGPAFLISGATHDGTTDLTEAVMRFLESGEAPAQGNLALPVIERPKPKVKPAVRKPKAKKAKSRPKAKAKSKAKVKAKAKPKSKQKTRR
jgi:hypothetical protein